MSDELWRWSAVRLAAALRRREISCHEVTTACIARLDAVNPRLNAVVEIHAESALAAARKADALIAAGAPLGLLHGIPITTKLNVDQQGSATTNGVTALQGVIAENDNPVISNLRQAGAIILGRTNVPAFSWRWFTDNDLHGRTLNPWNAAITPGGSSGGAAAAVASGIGPLALGSDLAGSIRYPAYACGVVGIRPTLGRIPAFDASAPVERTPFSQLMVTQGPLARNIDDLRLGLKAMAVGDVRDPWWVPAPFLPAPMDRPLRVAVCRQIDGFAVDRTVADAVAQAAGWLADAGCMIEDALPPRFAETFALFVGLMTEARHGFLQRIEAIGDDAIKRAARGMAAASAPLDLAAYMSALSKRTTLLRAWQAFLDHHDVLLMPTSWRAPLPLDLDQAGDAAMAGIIEAQSPLIAINVLGLPALALPTGSVDDVPQGVQLIAARFREETCFAAGALIEERAGLVTPIDPR